MKKYIKKIFIFNQYLNTFRDPINKEVPEMLKKKRRRRSIRSKEEEIITIPFTKTRSRARSIRKTTSKSERDVGLPRFRSFHAHHFRLYLTPNFI